VFVGEATDELAARDVADRLGSNVIVVRLNITQSLNPASRDAEMILALAAYVKGALVVPLSTEVDQSKVGWRSEFVYFAQPTRILVASAVATDSALASTAPYAFVSPQPLVLAHNGGTISDVKSLSWTIPDGVKAASSSHLSRSR
jgi:hypothetical protein